MAHTHQLSALSSAKNRDTFIFSHTTPTHLILGFNSKVTTISPSDIHRWCTICDYTPSSTSPDEFYICPVTMQPYGILRYYLEEAGLPLDPKSTVPYPQGDYGWFHYDGDKSLPLLIYNSPVTFYTLNELKTVPGHTMDMERKDHISTEIQDAVAKRDSGKCVLTHTDTDVGLTWILRPGAAHMAVDRVRSVTEFDETKWKVYSTAENVVTMSRQLSTFFQENAFGVDVGNDRKIVVFNDMGPATSLLPTHFPMGVGSDKLLFEHFRYSMRVHLMPGDISEDYSVHDIVDEIDELGHGDDWEMAEDVPLDDPRWRTPVGKDLLRSLMRDKLETEQAEEGSDSSSSDT